MARPGGSFASQKIQLLCSAKDELQSLEDTVQTIQAALLDAEKQQDTQLGHFRQQDVKSEIKGCGELLDTNPNGSSITWESYREKILNGSIQAWCSEIETIFYNYKSETGDPLSEKKQENKEKKGEKKIESAKAGGKIPKTHRQLISLSTVKWPKKKARLFESAPAELGLFASLDWRWRIDSVAWKEGSGANTSRDCPLHQVLSKLRKASQPLHILLSDCSSRTALFACPAFPCKVAFKVDLITVAQVVHWFDLPNFCSLVTLLLRKLGGVIAVWCYNDLEVSPPFNLVMECFHDTTLPFWDPNLKYIIDGYKKLPLPFDSVGLGCVGEPLPLHITKELSFKGFLRMLGSWSTVTTAKEQGVDLLYEGVARELEDAGGGPDLFRS
ncbi:hypothetical protein NL676_021368 [Syzygium grande]|nr:hypothetical protein NL676_021368 [Syzygium grande]